MSGLDATHLDNLRRRDSVAGDALADKRWVASEQSLVHLAVVQKVANTGEDVANDASCSAAGRVWRSRQPSGRF